MQKVRNIFFHSLMLVFFTAMSFASLLIYRNPQAREMMEKVSPELSYEVLLKQSIIGFVVTLCIAYTFYYLVFNSFFRGKITFRKAIWPVVAILVISIGQNLLYLINSKESYSFKMNGGIIFSFIFIGGISLGFRALLEYFNDKEKKKELVEQNLKSELDLLRSQINPHFLFNTLNNIDALIRKNPEKASDLLVKLSVQMRYMLYDSNTREVELEKEVQFMHDYIELQKLRIRNHQAVSFAFINHKPGTMVPPMLFICFIENAFKHCSNLTTDNAIRFSIKNGEQLLEFKSVNNCCEHSNEVKDKAGGIGIELVKRRLELLYPGRYRLHISNTGSQFIVELKIALHAA